MGTRCPCPTKVRLYRAAELWIFQCYVISTNHTRAGRCLSTPVSLEDGRRPLVACFDTPDFRFSILFQHLIGRCIKKVNLDGLGQLQEREEDTIRRNSGGPTVGTLERKRITRAGPRRYSSQIQTEDVGPFCKFFRKFSFLSHARSQLRSHLENYLRKVTSR